MAELWRSGRMCHLRLRCWVLGISRKFIFRCISSILLQFLINDKKCLIVLIDLIFHFVSSIFFILWMKYQSPTFYHLYLWKRDGQLKTNSRSGTGIPSEPACIGSRWYIRYKYVCLFFLNSMSKSPLGQARLLRLQARSRIRLGLGRSLALTKDRHRAFLREYKYKYKEFQLQIYVQGRLSTPKDLQTTNLQPRPLSYSL